MITYKATENEIIPLAVSGSLRHTIGLSFFLLLDSVVAEDQIDLLYDVVFATLIVQERDVDARFGVIIAILLIVHDKQPLSLHLKCFLKQNAVGQG